MKVAGSSHYELLAKAWGSDEGGTEEQIEEGLANVNF